MMLKDQVIFVHKAVFSVVDLVHHVQTYRVTRTCFLTDNSRNFLSNQKLMPNYKNTKHTFSAPAQNAKTQNARGARGPKTQKHKTQGCQRAHNAKHTQCNMFTYNHTKHALVQYIEKHLQSTSSPARHIPYVTHHSEPLHLPQASSTNK